MAIVSAKSQTGHDLPAFVTPDGEFRLLAALPNRGKFLARPFAASNPIIDRKDWITFSRSRQDVPILNQMQVGSCNPHGFTSALMRARSAANQKFALLSASFLYAQINGGTDQGSVPEDAANALASIGICLDSEVPEGFYTAGQIQRSHPTALQTAKRFTVDPAGLYSLSNFDELASAILLGYKCPFTVFVHGDWNTFDKNGSPPFYRGMGNHVTSDDDGLTLLPSGEWVIPSRNSWSTQWGNNGRYNLREAGTANQNGFVGYAFMFPGQDPLDPNIAPIAG